MNKDKAMPPAVKRQFGSTLGMVRSLAEWTALEEAVDTELEYYGNIDAAKGKVRQAKLFHRRHHRWPSDFDPAVDYVAEVKRRPGFPDWKP